MHILSTIKSYYEKLYTTKYPDENLTSNYIFDTKLEYVNMYLVCTYNMTRYYFHIIILSAFLYKTVCIFFTKQHIFICPIQLQFRFPPNLFLAIVNTHEMCHAKYSTWLYIYIFLININVNKRETLIKQIGYSQVSYKIYRKK